MSNHRLKSYAAAAFLTAVLLLAAGCRGGNKTGKNAIQGNPAANRYQLPDVPTMIDDQQQAMDYIVSHYWDRLLSEDRPGTRDTSLICGFSQKAFQEIFCQYALCLRGAGTDVALNSARTILDKIEAAQQQNIDGTLWRKFTDTYNAVLQDPNSPWRNEEYCIPLLEKRASSPLSTEEERLRAQKDLPLFCLNRLGEKANDFSFTLRNGRQVSLYGIDSEYTIIFFSNPGCTNCREVMESLQQLPNIDYLIAGKQLAVANVYPDEDLGEWIKYSAIYPENWINGYDHLLAVKNTPLYNIRAIPSVYLLDRDKRVILKDVPTDYLLQYLSQLFGL